ncbi:MAG: helix-hairpin-helix domain-containing protein [Verrucomicrobiota bacterium]
MIRSSFLALLLCAAPALQADVKKSAAPDKAPKTEKATPAPDKKVPAKEKPAAKPATPASGVDPADQALLDHANQELKKLTPAQTTNLLKLANEGTPEDLQTIPGVGEIKAAALKKARPFKTADQLIMVDGIGEVTFDGIVKWVKDGMPKDAPAPTKPAVKPAAKPETKPAVKPTAKPEAKPAVKPEAKPPTKPAALKKD